MKKQKAFISSIFFLLLWLFSGLNVYATDATWLYRYSSPAPDNFVWFEDVISVTGGGYLAAGRVWDSVTGDTAHDAFISRLDQNGQVIWSKNFSFPGHWSDELKSVVESHDGGFIATGKILLNGTDIYGRPGVVSAVMILKVDANGNLLWSKFLKNHGNSVTCGNRIKYTNDGNYIIVGEKIAYITHTTGVKSAITAGALITKINTHGEVIFSRAYYGDWTHSYAWKFLDIVQDSVGSYYAVGVAATEARSEGVGWSGMLLTKIDSLGGLIWAKKYDYAPGGVAAGLDEEGTRLLLANDSIYVTGATAPTFTLSKFTLSGTRNWTKQYFLIRGWDTGLGGARDFINSRDGNFFILAPGAGGIITKVDPQGDILWSKDWWGSGQPYSLTLEADNGFVVGGWDAGWPGTVSTLIKYDSHGNNCQETADLVFTVTEIEMLTNTLPYQVAEFSASSDEISVFSGPSLTFEKVCGRAPQMTVYMPHLTGTTNYQQDWSDYLEVDNYGDENAEFTITLYDDSGTELYSGDQSVNALSEAVIDLKALAGNTRCGKVLYHNDKLNFRLAYENNLGGGVAEFKLSDELKSNLGFYFSDFTPAIVWKGMALCNWGTTAANVTLTAQGAGVEHNGPTLNIAPNNKVVGAFSNWFPSLNFSQAKRIMVTSDQPTINGITISGDGACSLLLFTTAAPSN